MQRAIVMALFVLVGCRPEGTAAPIDQPEDPESPPKAVPMGDHFVQAGEIRDSLIAGELRYTKEPAQWLVDNLVTEDMPVRWRPHVPSVKRAAKQVVAAETIPDAAEAAGKLAAACGECHEATGVQPKPPERRKPLEDETTFAQMDRHAYAAERMWDGLIAPDEEAWKEGATIMGDAPLQGDAAPESVASLATELHSLAKAAVDLKPNARAKTYGAVIASCAACHNQLDTKKPAP